MADGNIISWTFAHEIHRGYNGMQTNHGHKSETTYDSNAYFESLKDIKTSMNTSTSCLAPQ